MSTSTSTDFSKFMEPVATLLLGMPDERHHDNTEWRYGTRGSLSIRIDKGTFYDNEAGKGGGTLDLIRREHTGMDRDGALAWLVKNKLIAEQKPTGKPRIVATYDYIDEAGTPLFQVRRMEPKNFIQAAADGKGGWICKAGCMKGVRLVPYRLSAVVAAVAAGRTIYIAEGEKGVHALESIGVVGTCSPGGAGKWRPYYNSTFAGADVVVLSDNDPQKTDRDGKPLWHPDGRPVLPGQDHAADVARNLSGVAAKVRVVMLPGLPIRGDAADWIAKGGTASELETIAVGTAAFDAAQPKASEIPAAGEDGDTGEADDKAKRAEAACMAEFNGRYMVVREAGKGTIYTQERDPILKRSYFCKMTAADLRLLHLNQAVFVGTDKDGNPVYKPAAELWLRHRDRRGFIYGVTFDPSRNGSENGVLNLWQGFAVEPRPGKWDLMYAHAFNILCGGDQTRFDYLMNWTARMLQFPAEQGHVAVVMRGGEGAGKGVFANVIRRIMGQHAMKISNGKHLTGNFNAHLRDCVFLFADEAFYAGDPSHVGVLKSIITEDSLTIEAKYANAAETPNFLHLMMASNEEWVVPASLDARRFFVLEALNDRAKDLPYFAAIMAQMEDGGYEAMLHDLLHHDLTGFNVRDVPVTAALQEQKKLSLGTSESWWLDVLHRGFVYKSKLGLDEYFGDWHEVMTTEVLYASYTDCAKSRGERHPMARENFGRFMLRMGCKSEKPSNAVLGEHITDVQTPLGTTRKAALITKTRATGYRLGDLATARAAFAKDTGLAPAWPDDGAGQ